MSQTELSYEETRQKISEALHKHSIGVLATSDGGVVTSREMRLIYDGLTIYCYTSMDSRKFKQITSNPNVAISVSAIQIEGVASILGHPAEPENTKFFELYKEQQPQAFKISYNEYLAEGKHAEVQLISITPRRATLYVSGPPAISAGYTFVGYLDILNIEKKQAHRIGVYEYKDSTAYSE
jgi:general stress protein 26